MKTLFTCILLLFSASFCVSVPLQEKQDFVREIYNRDLESIAVNYLKEPVPPKTYAYEPIRYSWWEVYILEFDVDEDGRPDFIAGNCATSYGVEPLSLYRKPSGSWDFDCQIFELGYNVKLKSGIETADGRTRLCEFPGDYLPLERNIEKSLHSTVPGTPQEPFISLETWRNWNDLLQQANWNDNPLKTLRKGGPPETCPGINKEGLLEQFSNFIDKIGFSILRPGSDGEPTCWVAPGGVRDMIADPDFRSWVHTMPIDIFQGSNAIPVQVAEPRLQTRGCYRVAIETNKLSRTEREGLAETLAKHGFSTNAVWMISADLNGDGVFDALVTTNRLSETAAGKVEWRTWLQQKDGWMHPETPVRQIETDNAVRTLRRERIKWELEKNAWRVIDSAMYAPPIPPVIQAGTNDFYRLWPTRTRNVVNVFSVTGPNPWDVASPLVDAVMPETFLKTRFLNGYRRCLLDRIQIHSTFYPNVAFIPLRDFFECFQPYYSLELSLGAGSTGILVDTIEQMDRLLPEPLLPDVTEPSRP